MEIFLSLCFLPPRLIAILSPKPWPEAYLPPLTPLFRMRIPSSGPTPHDPNYSAPSLQPAAARPPLAGLVVPTATVGGSPGPDLSAGQAGEAGLTLSLPRIPGSQTLQPCSDPASPVPDSGSAAHPAGLASQSAAGSRLAAPDAGLVRA